MDEFEKILRWAWYIDYGETPEQSIEKIKIFSLRVVLHVIYLLLIFVFR